MATKELRPNLRLVKQPHGGALIQGGTGAGGRPPDAFKALCRELVTREKTIDAVTAILDNPDHQHYMRALEWAAAHGYGKPKDTDITVNNVTIVKQEWTWGDRKVGF